MGKFNLNINSKNQMSNIANMGGAAVVSN